MLEVITYQDLTARTEESEEQGPQVFKLEVDNVHFGFLYLTPTSYTLAWSGLLDFKKVDDEAHNFLYRQLDERKKSFLEISYHRIETKVSLIAYDRLSKYSLNVPGQHHRYKEALREGHAITFIRYDFIIEESPLLFCFTVENPHDMSPDDCELAVMLPRSQPVSKGLLRWIINHHTSLPRLLKHEVDLRASGSTLSRLVMGNVDSANGFAFG